LRHLTFIEYAYRELLLPVHIFWLEAGEAFPQTGSGKIKKHILRERGAKHVLSLNASFR
jgi:hypothetical protein